MSLLFSPFDVGPLKVKNRIAIAPMCQYSAFDGLAQPWHAQHLGRLVLSGAGLVILEATAVSPEGRITPQDLGLWNEAQEEALARLLQDARTYSDTPIGVQLGHAGRKASTAPPFKGGGALSVQEGGWQVLAPSPAPFRDDWPVPAQMTQAQMEAVVADFEAAASRADRAGFDLAELHAAHGYLLSAFLSPLSNRRDDAFGGSAENRARFPLMAARALRKAWPKDKALGARFNGSDWVEGGLELEEVIDFAKALHEIGYDYLHLSSGGNAARASIPGDQPGYQLGFAEAVKTAVPEAVVMAVGMIHQPDQAEAVIAQGQADLVAVARAVLDNPNWPHRAAVALGEPGRLPAQYERADKAHWPGWRA
ncbi:hypothetical protein LTR94_025984 [Friedmanniomyces endolithicus]|nr:hypothetical protein LTR94_025984 [Friedmanniomyces endolithicus]